ncbi:MAG: hypothetical protein HQL56_13995 [Magnetococcales bacterium]|nr:hypothetical protein [Magnetococcales bacterium]
MPVLPAMESWILVVAGGLLALFGIYKIVANSFSLFFWVLLVAVGMSGVSYGLKHDSVVLSADTFSQGLLGQLKETLEPGRELSRQSLEKLCLSLAAEPKPATTAPAAAKVSGKPAPGGHNP